MPATVINHNGFVAIQIGGWVANQEKPIEEKWLSVSNVPFARYSQLEGAPIKFRGNIGQAYHNGKQYTFNTADKDTWTRTTLTRPAKRPRKGKRQGVPYTWKWERGKWERVWLWDKAD